MAATPQHIVVWVGTQVLPHEAAVRAWLRRSKLAAQDIDDLIQEAYCKLAGLKAVDHISRPDRYFFRVVRNLLGEQLRRARVVRIETVAEIEALGLDEQTPSPEQTESSSREWTRVREIIQTLPERCRRIFELRKLDGLSQREVAARLGVSESVVENDGVKGMRLILQALKEDGLQDRAQVYERSAKRK